MENVFEIESWNGRYSDNQRETTPNTQAHAHSPLQRGGEGEALMITIIN